MSPCLFDRVEVLPLKVVELLNGEIGYLVQIDAFWQTGGRQLSGNVIKVCTLGAHLRCSHVDDAQSQRAED